MISFTSVAEENSRLDVETIVASFILLKLTAPPKLLEPLFNVRSFVLVVRSKLDVPPIVNKLESSKPPTSSITDKLPEIAISPTLRSPIKFRLLIVFETSPMDKSAEANRVRLSSPPPLPEIPLRVKSPLVIFIEELPLNSTEPKFASSAVTSKLALSKIFIGKAVSEEALEAPVIAPPLTTEIFTLSPTKVKLPTFIALPPLLPNIISLLPAFKLALPDTVRVPLGPSVMVPEETRIKSPPTMEVPTSSV